MRYALVGLETVTFALMIVFMALFWRSVRRSKPDGVRAPNAGERPMPGMPEDSADPSKQQGMLHVEAAAALRAQRAIVFRNQQDMPLPLRAAWGDIPYDELAPMFLDQFLLRYFPKLMEATGAHMMQPEYSTGRPWKDFLAASLFGWGKDTPLLFEQMSGYKLSDMQLDQAMGEFVSRLRKSPVIPTNPASHGLQNAPPAARSECSDCRQMIPVSSNGLLIAHADSALKKCPGSGQLWNPPRAETPVQHEAENAG